MFPDKIWEVILDRGGLASAIVLFVVFGASIVVYKLWLHTKAKDEEINNVRAVCAADMKVVYEARLADMNKLLDKVNTVVFSNTSTLADNSRVVESRAEAITAMKEVLTKIVVMMESDTAARRSQADRIENAIIRLMDIIRPQPPKSGLQ